MSKRKRDVPNPPNVRRDWIVGLLKTRFELKKCEFWRAHFTREVELRLPTGRRKYFSTCLRAFLLYQFLRKTVLSEVVSLSSTLASCSPRDEFFSPTTPRERSSSATSPRRSSERKVRLARVWDGFIICRISYKDSLWNPRINQSTEFLHQTVSARRSATPCPQIVCAAPRKQKVK